jgi:Ca2+-binding RTX toxin-like protein
MLRSSLLTGLALTLCLSASASAASDPRLDLKVDAGSDAWTNQPARTVKRSITQGAVDGLQLTTTVDGAVVDTSATLDLPMTFADGDHAVGVEASAPGYTTSYKVLSRVRVDTTAPTVTLDIAPLAYWYDMPFVGHAYADDKHSGVKDRVLTLDGGPASWGSYFSLPLAPGNHTFVGTVTDVAGNTASASAPVTVQGPPPAQPKPPKAQITPKPKSGSRTRSSTGTRKPAKPAYLLCANLKRGEQCGPGNGRRTKGGAGTGNVSHQGWPAVTGVLWKVLDSGDHQRTGGPDNDELLGHHGDDTLRGLAGKDILWGDWDPDDNNGRQKDKLYGGGGNDWIYPSHGTNRISGGSGGDKIIAYYGHGTIDCGPGRDFAQVRMNGAYKLRNCEVVRHFTGG